MAISDELLLLDSTKTAIKNAVEAKGVAIQPTDQLADIPTRISEIETSSPQDVVITSLTQDSGTATLSFKDGVVDNYIIKDGDSVLENIDFKNRIYEALSPGDHTISVESYLGNTFVSSDSQVVNVPATANNYLFSQYLGGICSLSLRRTHATYSGNILTVRNASSVEASFGLVNDVIDTAGILAHIGSGDGWVTKWNGVTENGSVISFTQTSVASQPKIAIAGAITLLNGKPSIQFDGVDDFLGHDGLNSVWTFLHNGTKNFITTVASGNKTSRADIFGNITSSGDSGIILSLPIDSGNKVRFLMGNGSGNIGALNSSSNIKNAADRNIILQHSDISNATASERSYLKLNGVLTKNNALTAAPSASAPSTVFGIGSRSGTAAASPYQGKIQEINFWQNDLLADIDTIETELNAYYTV